MRFSSLSSGSSGNATFLQSGDTRILIDCGLPLKTLAARLQAIGESIDRLDGIIMSHEHGDHQLGINRLVRERIRRGRSLPVYLTYPTAELIKWEGLEQPPVKPFTAGRKFQVGDIEITPFTIPHDAVDAVGFVATDRQGVKAGVVMDLGFIPDAARYWLRGCSLIMLESNYDTTMLQEGSYPEPLKRRIAGDCGHLPNSAAIEFIRNDLDASVLRHLVLCHLSRQNNTEFLAINGSSEAIASRGLRVSMSVATHLAATPLIEI